jgi:hypothetical protein
MSTILQRIGELLRMKQPKQAAMAEMKDMEKTSGPGQRMGMEQLPGPGKMEEMEMMSGPGQTMEMEPSPEPGHMMEMEQRSEMEHQDHRATEMGAVSDEPKMTRMQPDRQKEKNERR